MKKILDSFINFTLTLSGRANPNTERQSFLTALVFSLVHLLCSLFLLRLCICFVHWKSQYFKNVISFKT